MASAAALVWLALPTVWWTPLNVDEELTVRVADFSFGNVFHIVSTKPKRTLLALARCSFSISREAIATRSSSDMFHSSSPSKQKYSMPIEASLDPSGTIHGLHDLKFWIRSTRTPGWWM